MELLEIVFVFTGRNCCFFHGAPDAGVRDGSILLYCGVPYDHFYRCPEIVIRGSGVRVAVSGVYYFDDQRCTVLLHRYFGTVSCEDLYGG